MSGEWQNGLCGCFGDCCLCLMTYFCPCYVVGKVAEKVGESCCMHAVLTFVPVANLICQAQVRGKIRESRGIDGTFCKDFCLHWFCGFCAVIQEAREVNALDKAAMADEGISRE